MFIDPVKLIVQREPEKGLKPTFHELAVPLMCLRLIFGPVRVVGVDCRFKHSSPPSTDSRTLLVVSADFVHHLPQHQAVEMENKAAVALSMRLFGGSSGIDDPRSFRELFRWTDGALQWVGRDRSPGENGVGYMSFLLRNVQKSPPTCDWAFVTAFDADFRSRECLGQRSPTGRSLQDLIAKVTQNARDSSRLTSGRYLDVPLVGYSVTWLFREAPNVSFIRGWHAVECQALFLPVVLLEHTYPNGTWIDDKDTAWPDPTIFNLFETLNELEKKAGRGQKCIRPNFLTSNVKFFSLPTPVSP